MNAYDSQRKRVTFGPVRGRGGEAVVYSVDGHAGVLAKHYLQVRPGYKDKLALMISKPPDDPSRRVGHASIAWPTDLLFDAQGQFIGFLMPEIQGAVPLLKVFNPKLRAQTLPDFDWRYLHRAARNLAAALGALHVKGYIVGDLNEGNILVTPAALITLIDCDSFQVREKRNAQIIFYPCPVGKPEYTPPELQGQLFGDVVRQPEHDLFGLGVLVFQLLMEGSHPFRSQWQGQDDPPPLEQKISQGLFPYSLPPSRLVAPPLDHPNLDLLHPRVAELILRCFADGHHNDRLRPSATEWEQVLAEAEAALASCSNGHYFSSHLAKCPQCRLGRWAVQMPLPSVIRRPTVPSPKARPLAPLVRPLSAQVQQVPQSAPHPVSPPPVPTVAPSIQTQAATQAVPQPVFPPSAAAVSSSARPPAIPSVNTLMRTHSTQRVLIAGGLVLSLLLCAALVLLMRPFATPPMDSVALNPSGASPVTIAEAKPISTPSGMIDPNILATTTSTSTRTLLQITATLEPLEAASIAVGMLRTRTPTPLRTVRPSSTPTFSPTTTLTLAPTPTTPTTRVAQSPTPAPVPTVVSVVAPKPPGLLRAPVLQAPENDQSTALDQPVTFVWSWSGPSLSPNQGFEVRIWKQSQPDHYGAADPVDITTTMITPIGAYGVQQGGLGDYYWTVAVVQRQPYTRIGAESPPRLLRIAPGNAGPAAPTLAPP